MAQVLIRDVEDAVVEKLRSNAVSNGRSLEAELRMVLRRAAARDSDMALEELRRILERLGGRVFSDSAELIREDRDSR